MPKLTIDIEARLAQFQDALTSIGKSGERTARQLDRAFSGLKGTLATLGVGLSVAGITAIFKSAIDKADELGKLSQKVGITVESLSALKHAAELSDVSIEQLQTGLQQLAKHAQEAQTGAGEAADTFRALGIAVKDASGNLKPTEELLLVIAERFVRMEDGAGKTALAMRLFGRSGAELIPLLNQGRTGIEALRKEAERLGIIISTDTAKAAEQFNDDLKRLTSSSDAFKIKLAEDVLPALNLVVKEMLRAKLEGEGFLGVLKALAQPWLEPRLKAEREIIEKTGDLLDTQNEILRKRSTATREEMDALEEHADRLRARLDLLTRQRQELSGETESPAAKIVKQKAPALPGPDTALMVIKQQTEAEEEFAKVMREVAQLTDDYNVKIRERERLTNIFGEETDGISSTTEDLALRLKTLLETIDATQEYDITVGQLKAGFDGLGNKIAENDKLTKDLGFTFASAFEDAIVGGKKLRDVLQGLAQDILRIFVRTTVTQPLAAQLAGAFAGAFTGGGGVEARGGMMAQHGADFTVGGSGGVDSQLVRLWATPGERVTVTPPGKTGGGVTIVQNINVDSRSDIASVRQAMRVAKDEAVAEVADRVMRGGAFSRPFRG
jgi:ribosomal protein L12E/L44/L45/RPP1/RPP2